MRMQIQADFMKQEGFEKLAKVAAARQQAKNAIQQWGQAEVDFMVACQANCQEIEGDLDTSNVVGSREKKRILGRSCGETKDHHPWWNCTKEHSGRN